MTGKPVDFGETKHVGDTNFGFTLKEQNILQAFDSFLAQVVLLNGY